MKGKKYPPEKDPDIPNAKSFKNGIVITTFMLLVFICDFYLTFWHRHSPDYASHANKHNVQVYEWVFSKRFEDTELNVWADHLLVDSFVPDETIIYGFAISTVGEKHGFSDDFWSRRFKT